MLTVSGGVAGKVERMGEIRKMEKAKQIKKTTGHFIDKKSIHQSIGKDEI